MKKILIPIVLISALTLTACGDDYENERSGDKVGEVIYSYSRYDIVRDIETGCLYLKGGYNSISPYYDETGKVAGCGEENFDKKKYE